LIVPDANVLAYVWIHGQFTELARRSAEKDPLWLVPPLWRSELRSVLMKYVRNGSMSVSHAVASMQRAEAAWASRERPVDSAHVLHLAAISGCSAYDCEYVALAEDLGVQLLTADKRLLAKFPGRAISMEEFVRS
jgi:predicted nucleic acid-binding protein